MNYHESSVSSDLILSSKFNMKPFFIAVLVALANAQVEPIEDTTNAVLSSRNLRDEVEVPKAATDVKEHGKEWFGFGGWGLGGLGLGGCGWGRCNGCGWGGGCGWRGCC